MTREDAVKELKLIAKVTMWNDRREAVEMAIEALSVEPKTGEWVEDGSIEKCNQCGEPRDFPHWKCCPNCGARMNGDREIIKRIEELPLAAEHPKRWIPVGERLPENSEPVLATYHWLQDSYEVLIGEYWGKTTEECPEEEKGWGRYGDHVTAWMPLPEPYKGK